MEKKKEKAAGKKVRGVKKERRAAVKGAVKTKPEYSTLTTESGSYETTLNKMYELRKPWNADNPKHILSFMPGNIEDIKIKVGDSVKEGDPLLIFRAMKMNNSILAPVAGKIKSINVKVGENIPKNMIMIEIE